MDVSLSDQGKERVKVLTSGNSENSTGVSYAVIDRQTKSLHFYEDDDEKNEEEQRKPENKPNTIGGNLLKMFKPTNQLKQHIYTKVTAKQPLIIFVTGRFESYDPQIPVTEGIDPITGQYVKYCGDYLSRFYDIPDSYYSSKDFKDHLVRNNNHHEEENDETPKKFLKKKKDGGLKAETMEEQESFELASVFENDKLKRDIPSRVVQSPVPKLPRTRTSDGRPILPGGRMQKQKFMKQKRQDHNDVLRRKLSWSLNATENVYCDLDEYLNDTDDSTEGQGQTGFSSNHEEESENEAGNTCGTRRILY